MADLDTGYNYDGSGRTYSTIAAALAVAVDYDNIQIWYSSTLRSPWWFTATIATDLLVGLEGMLPRRECIVAPTGSNHTWYLYCTSAKSSDVTLQNFTMPYQYSTIGLYYWNTNSGNTGAVHMKRIWSYGLRAFYHRQYGYGDVKYCMGIRSGSYPVYQTYQTLIQSRYINCGAIGGYNCWNAAGGGVSHLIHNCYAFLPEAGTTRFGGTAVSSSSDYVYIDDTGESVTGTNSRNDINLEEDCKFACDEAGNLEYRYSETQMDLRPLPGSVLIGNGGYLAGATETTDIDGQPIADHPIGPSVGVRLSGQSGATTRNLNRMVIG